MIIELHYNDGTPKRKFIEVEEKVFAKIRELDKKHCLCDTMEGQELIQELQKHAEINIPVVV